MGNRSITSEGVRSTELSCDCGMNQKHFTIIPPVNHRRFLHKCGSPRLNPEVLQNEEENYVEGSVCAAEGGVPSGATACQSPLTTVAVCVCLKGSVAVHTPGDRIGMQPLIL
ncbi:unnamed protein product [Leuciscus chuanchicus]